jgi:hypothetical protein
MAISDISWARETLLEGGVAGLQREKKLPFLKLNGDSDV